LTRAVSNTGPLLHLLEANALQALEICESILIPPAVNEELTRLLPGISVEEHFRVQIEHLEDRLSTEALKWQQAGLLHLGEAQAIALTRQVGADWFLTDDSAARWVAMQQGIEAHGSLGVVIGAAALGHLDQAAAMRLLKNLESSSLWISPRIMDEAIAAIDVLFKGPAPEPDV
jgi:predicted nucleic acid-binding protein